MENSTPDPAAPTESRAAVRSRRGSGREAIKERFGPGHLTAASLLEIAREDASPRLG